MKDRMIQYKIYTKNFCVYCVKAKELLKAKGVSYDEVQLDTDDDKLEFKKTYPSLKTVPQIFTYESDNDLLEHIGGYEDLIEHFRIISEGVQ